MNATHITELLVAFTWDGMLLPAAEHVRFRLTDAADAIRLTVDAPFYDDPPPPTPPGFTDGLWDFEVVELFIVGAYADGEAPRYLEIELSPHGHFLVLHLHGIRQRVGVEKRLSYTAQIYGERWTGEALIPCDWLPPGPHTANVFALHGCGTGRRYLAMTPLPGPHPDFHQIHLFQPL